jgi:tol-pal system-associated acyl-CoA thioesterase
MAGSGDEFRLSLRVYIEDTDAGGIVYYVNYLKFMERARTEYMRSLGIGKETIFEQERAFVVHRVQLDYHLSATLDDELQVTARPVQSGGAYIDFEQHVYRGDTLLCAGEIRVVCVNRATMKPAAMPQVIRRALAQR